jgi:HEPN domain-containing protein
MNREDLKRLSLIRLGEAQILLAASAYSGAYYLAGYAVECALKACIAKQVQRFEFPDRERVQKSYSHRLSELATLAGLGDDLKLAMRSNAKLASSWALTSSWSEQSRYEVHTERDAVALVTAVGKRGNGVLPWIRQRW